MTNPTSAASAPHLTSADASITSSPSQPLLQGATASTDDKTKSLWQKFKDFIQTPKGMQVMSGVAVGVGGLITAVTVIGGIALASTATGGIGFLALVIAGIFFATVVCAGTALMMAGGAGLVLTAGAGNETDKDKPADALEKNNMSVTTQEQFIKDAEKRRQEELAERARAEKAEKDRQAQQPSPATS